MKPSILYLIKFIVHFIPETRGFSFKRFLYRLAGIHIGDNVRICSSARFVGNGKLVIGENTWVGHDCLIVSSSSVVIGDNVDIGPQVFIGTGTHVIDIKSANIAGRGVSKDVSIEDGCWLCVRSTILPGVRIGQKSIVAGCALVIYDVPKNTIVGGLPASTIKKM